MITPTKKIHGKHKNGNLEIENNSSIKWKKFGGYNCVSNTRFFRLEIYYKEENVL